LDSAAIESHAEAWPGPRSADELHEALLLPVMTDAEMDRASQMSAAASGEIGSDVSSKVGETSTVGLPDTATLNRLVEHKRAGRLLGLPHAFWIATERLPMLQHVYPSARVEPALNPPQSASNQPWERADAIRELVRGRMEFSGPVAAGSLAELLCLSNSEIEQALLALEGEGFVLRGKFHPDTSEGKGLVHSSEPAQPLSSAEIQRKQTELEWCERRLLARIHRLTINRLRRNSGGEYPGLPAVLAGMAEAHSRTSRARARRSHGPPRTTRRIPSARGVGAGIIPRPRGRIRP
jgi:ATP-dependent Lhr-like helicase